MAEKKDYYALLGVRRSATPEEIRQAYFAAARHLHPDKNLAPGETELFLGVQEAYEILSSERKRNAYDATLPPEKAGALILDQKILFSRQSLLHIDEPQMLYVTLEFSAPKEVVEQPAPPLNLCLVLDRSTSMQGSNMEIVKATATRIMQKLKSQDVFSVVAFSDRAETIIPATHITELSKQEARIQLLSPSGGTEIYSGLEKGYNEITRNINRSHVNHIILITDGHTYGDEENCFALAQQAAEKGVGITGLGIGAEWNDNFLDKLASITGSTSMYVPRAQDLQQTLLDKFNQLGNAYAEETCLEFEPIPGIDVNYAFRMQPEAGLLSFTSPTVLGPIPWNNSLKMLMEFIIQPGAVQQNAVVLFDGKISLVLAGHSIPEELIPVHLARPVREGTSMEAPPVEIVDALSRLRLYRLQEQARLEVNAGEYDQAAEHLVRLATHLLASGERALAKTALLEAENIQQKKSFSKTGGKEIKYGTRALLRSGRIAEDK